MGLALTILICGVVRASGEMPVGEVRFANSGAPAAQSAFLRGLAQLHNFEYDDASAAFIQAQKADPGFAMAYWGEAMTHNHPIWMEQDVDAARKALEKLGPTPEARSGRAPTAREKAYLDAAEILYGNGTKNERDVRYAVAMRSLSEKYPDDADAAAFSALAILGTAHEGRDVPTYMRAAAILEELTCRYPAHPGAAHYLIHSYDDPAHAVLGLRAARRYSKIAPDAAHAQHMTSHIFIAMGMWDDVVAANETAVAVVNRGEPAMRVMRAVRELNYERDLTPLLESVSATLQQVKGEWQARIVTTFREAVAQPAPCAITFAIGDNGVENVLNNRSDAKFRVGP